MKLSHLATTAASLLLAFASTTPASAQPIAPEVNIFFAQLEILAGIISAYETPITARFTGYYHDVWWNCIASYSDKFLDSITNERPVVPVTNSSFFNSANRAVCGAQASVIYSSFAVPGGAEALVPGMQAAVGLTLDPELHPDVAACGMDVDCLKDIAELNDFDALIMGHIVGKMVWDFSVTDGFNQLGMDDGCEVNCRPFRDTTGFDPTQCGPSNKKKKGKDKHRQLRDSRGGGGGKRRNGGKGGGGKRGGGGKSKGKCSDNWEPLMEDNGLGFFFFQKHVTPQIGPKGIFRSLPETDRKNRVARQPNYSKDRIEEAIKVVERMRTLDDVLKLQVEVFDNKIAVGAAIVQAFVAKVLGDGYVDTELGVPGHVLSYERMLHFVVGFTFTEWDTIIIAWKEKVNFNLVRPTSVIKRWGDKLITTWAPGGSSNQTFRASDFEAYIRVMPHAEYISASACIFEGMAEFVDMYLERIGLDPATFAIQYGPFPPGSSVVEPGVVPSSEVTLTYPNIRDMARKGSDSRLDGGMHFEDSVPAAEELCVGIGKASIDSTFAFLGH